MAENSIEDIIEFGIRIKPDEFDTSMLDSVRKYLSDVANAMVNSGKSADEVFSQLRRRIEEFRTLGIQGDSSRKITDDVAKSLGSEQLRKFYSGQFSPKPPPDFSVAWNRLAMSVVRFKTTLWQLEKPFKMVYNFTDQLRRLNLQFSNLAQNAGLTASSLAAQSGVFSALGANASEYANFRNSFLMEMEKRRIGLGNGGKFTQTMMHYGIRYNPNDPEATLRSIASFMSSASRSESQKLMVGQMLGLSSAMQNALRRGPDFIDQYERDMRSRTGNKTAAAKEAEELSLEMEKMKASVADFRDLLFTDVAPAIRFLIKPLAEIVEVLKKIPPEARKPLEVLLAIGAIVRTLWLGKRLLLGAIKGFAGAFSDVMLAKGLGAAAEKAGTGVLSSGAGAAAGRAGAGAAGGMLSRGAGAAAGGAVGIGAQVVDAVGGLVQRQISIHSLSVLEKVVDQWHKEWSIFYTAIGRGASKQSLARAADRLEVDKHILISGLQFQNAIGNISRNSNDAGGSGTTIEKMTITINSAAMDPKDLATEIEAVMVKNCQEITYRPGGGRR